MERKENPQESRDVFASDPRPSAQSDCALGVSSDMASYIFGSPPAFSWSLLSPPPPPPWVTRILGLLAPPPWVTDNLIFLAGGLALVAVTILISILSRPAEVIEQHEPAPATPQRRHRAPPTTPHSSDTATATGSSTNSSLSTARRKKKKLSAVPALPPYSPPYQLYSPPLVNSSLRSRFA